MPVWNPEQVKTMLFPKQIQYAKANASDVKDTIEEKYELVQKKMADYWEQINNEEGMDGEEIPKVSLVHMADSVTNKCYV